MHGNKTMGKIQHIVQELIDSAAFLNSYLRKDSIKIKQCVQEKMAERNCSRILLMTPIFILFNIFNIFNFKQLHPSGNNSNAGQSIFDILHPEFQTVLVLNLFMILFIIIYGILIARLLFWEKEISESEKTAKCKLLYRTFWGLWLFGIICTALEQILFGRGGMIYYILICLIVCVVPLYSIREFLSILLIGTLLSSSSIMRFGPHNDMKIFIYTYIAMFIIGFIAQRFEVEMWTLKEYVYVNTFIDPLTGLLNRRGGNALFSSEIMKAKGKAKFGIIMLDIDYFKKYNDTLGHDAGDVCLQTVSSCIRKAVESRTNIMIRHGGEEFVIILINADKEETLKWGEQIRSTVFEEGLPAPYKKVADVVTVSIGISTDFAEQDDRYEEFLELADQALYQAKNSGRNQVAYQAQEY